ncbi:MAG: secretion system protein F [Methylophaga sp.]|nr:MAG: secretion system protein F [Methylophaga sp.]
MFDDLIVLAAGMSVGTAVACSVLLLILLVSMVGKDSRKYMDPPPAFMLPVWPLIKIVSFFIGNNLPASYLNKLDAKLQKNSLGFVLTAEEYFSACFVFALLLPALAAIPLVSSGDVSVGLLIILAIIGFILPEAWVKDARRKRDVAIIQSLPTYLDYLSMCVDAGLNFSGALKQAVEKGPKGAMNNEFRIVLRDINSGQTRADALSRLEQRVALKDVTIFVSAVIQAEKMGSSMRETLLIQAEQRLDERFQRAEKMAMEAPVKLVIPLIAFIFPLTFIILLFPIVIKFLEQGAL